MALLAVATLGVLAPAAGASPVAAGVLADPSPAFPPIGSWLPVFDEEFDGTFNGSSIVDTRNINGAVSPDGLDDRVWVDLYGRSNADAVSVTAQAPGGDPGASEGGYLTMRTFTETLAGGTKQLHTVRALATGETGENPTHTTRGFFEYTYGYAEARIKLKQPVGQTSAFWLYSRDLHLNASDPLRDPANAGIEVDIFEEWDTPDRVSHATHWDGYADAHQSDGTGNSVLCPGSPCHGNFHTYGVLWSPTGYRFFIDGQETQFWPRGVSHHPEFLILSCGVRPDVTTDFGPLGDPRNIEMVMDYVKVWQPALSDIADTTTRPNVPVSIPFTAASVVSEQSPTLPGSRVADITKGSSNEAVVANTDIVITGTDADRTLTLTPRQAGITTILLIARNAQGQHLGVDTFTVTVSGLAAPLPTLAPGALPDVHLTATTPRVVAFTTASAEGDMPTVTARSSNQYLLPDAGLGVTGMGRTRAVSMTPLPTRTGTADVTVTARDPVDGSTSTDTFHITVTYGQLTNPGFETGFAPWQLVGGAGAPVASAAHSGTQGFHMDIGAVKHLIPVEPNTTYVIGGWGRVNTAGGTFELGILDTHTYPDQNGQPVDPDGDQRAVVVFNSTAWSRKEVVFTTGPHTREVEVFANNYLVSTVAGFDVDDVELMAGPEVTHMPDQSIGHAHCVRPSFWVGRVGLDNDPWTVTAAVTGGNTSLITGVAVESPNPSNRHERALRITPTTNQNASGQTTITITVTDIEGRRRTDDISVWVNAGSFRNGSFEYPALGQWNPFTQPPPGPSPTYPGCATSPVAWNAIFATYPRSRVDHINPYDWKYGFRNPGLIISQVSTDPTQPTGGIVYQDVAGLETDTEYVLSGWAALNTWPDSNVTVARGARLRVDGDVTPITPSTGEAVRTVTGWQFLSVRFRTGMAGTAMVSLQAPDHLTYIGLFHDITLTRVAASGHPQPASQA